MFYKKFKVTFISLFAYLCCVAANAQSYTNKPNFRIKSSNPEELLIKIYNNALIGNDRLSDIEYYMSSGLKNDYQRALKASTNGNTCNIPKILSNRFFSSKLLGFKVEQINQTATRIEEDVIIDTGAEGQPRESILSKFDPKVYERIKFNFIRRIFEWKIDNINTSEPDMNRGDQQIVYKAVDLRELLRSCK